MAGPGKRFGRRGSAMRGGLAAGWRREAVGNGRRSCATPAPTPRCAAPRAREGGARPATMPRKPPGYCPRLRPPRTGVTTLFFPTATTSSRLSPDICSLTATTPVARAVPASTKADPLPRPLPQPEPSRGPTGTNHPPRPSRGHSPRYGTWVSVPLEAIQRPSTVGANRAPIPIEAIQRPAMVGTNWVPPIEADPTGRSPVHTKGPVV